MNIVFTKHAQLKFEILEAHGLRLTEHQIKNVVTRPEKVSKGSRGRLIAQRRIDATHLIRVVYEEEEKGIIKIIMFYPARRQRYED